MSEDSKIKVPHNRLTFGEEEERAVSEVIKSGYWAQGPKVAELESKLSEVSDVSHAVCVGSGLGALRLAMLGLGVSSGDEVIVPGYSCVAVANATLALGAKPVAADIRKGDWNIDPSSVEKLISPNTKAIVAVHMYGSPAPIKELKDFGIPIIEDCAHAFGDSVKNMNFGSLGDVAILSFYATKLMGAGKGGALLTRDEGVAEKVREFRFYCDQPMNAAKLNDFMTDIEAAIALCQLERLPEMISARKGIAQRYDAELKTLSEESQLFSLPDITTDRIWYRYTVEMTSVTAQKMIDSLGQFGIHAERPAEDWREGDAKDLPVSSTAYDHIVSLPCYPTLTENEQAMVCDAFKKVITQLK